MGGMEVSAVVRQADLIFSRVLLRASSTLHPSTISSGPGTLCIRPYTVEHPFWLRAKEQTPL